VPKKLSIDHSRDHNRPSLYGNTSMDLSAVSLSRQPSHLNVSSPYPPSHQFQVPSPGLNNGANLADSFPSKWRTSDPSEPSQSYPTQLSDQLFVEENLQAPDNGLFIPNFVIEGHDTFWDQDHLVDPFRPRDPPMGTEQPTSIDTRNSNSFHRNHHNSGVEAPIGQQLYRRSSFNHVNASAGSSHQRPPTMTTNVSSDKSSLWLPESQNHLSGAPFEDYTFQEPSSPFSNLGSPALSRHVPDATQRQSSEAAGYNWDRAFPPHDASNPP
jgi:hypothetical protein